MDGDQWNDARLRGVVQQRLGVEYFRGYIWEIAVRAGVFPSEGTDRVNFHSTELTARAAS